MVLSFMQHYHGPLSGLGVKGLEELGVGVFADSAHHSLQSSYTFTKF